MATYAVDSNRQEITATGKASPVMEWDTDAEGKRRPSDRQAHHDETGMPLWNVEAMYDSRSFGNEVTATVQVTVGAADKPTIAKFTPVTFTNLTVDVVPNKAGGFRENWRAEALADFTPAKDTAPASTPTASGSGKAARSGEAKEAAA